MYFHNSQRGGAAPKVLLLILFVGLMVGWWYWKISEGVSGNSQPMPPTAGYIAFIEEGKGGRHNVFMIKPDGSGQKQLTDDKDNKLSLCWSPDGKQLCFAGEARDDRGVTTQLFLIGSDGVRQITQGSGGKDSPQWRPDGKQIAFLTGGAIKVVLPNGTPGDQIYPPPHKGENPDSGGTDSDDAIGKLPPIRSFRWSPNSVGIAAIQVTEGDSAPAVGSANWFQNGDNSSPTPAPASVPEPESLLLLPTLDSKPALVAGTACRELGFEWMPDSSQLVVSLDTRGSQHGIGLFHTDDVRLPSVGILTTAGYTVSPKDPSVSGDGKQVAFEAWRLSSAEDSSLMGIAVMPIDTDHPLMVRSPADLAKLPLKIKGDAHDPKWSPDGTKLIYTMSGPSGRTLWVANADGSNPVQLTKDGNVVDAAWSPAR